MTMGLQDLMMFRDNLQQPTPTGMDNLRNLQALTMQGMAAEDYMNEPQPMMMNTGLMSLPVAQAGFGGFVKSITKGISGAVKGVAKGVTGAVKGIAKGVKNIASSPIGQIALPLALTYFAGPLAGKLGLGTGLGAKAAVVGGGTGLLSLAGGAKPEEALRRGATAAALTYGGGKLFGSGGAAGADKTAGTVGKGTAGISDVGNVQSYGMPYQQVSMVPDSIAQQAAGLSTVAPTLTSAYNVPLDPNALSATQGVNVLGDTASQAALEAAQATPTIGQRIAELGGTALDKTQAALQAGVQKVAALPTSQKLLLGTAALSGLGGGSQPITQDQLAMAGLTPVETDFDKQVFTYKDAQGNILTTEEALRRIQQASQNIGAGGQKVASGVRAGFERVDDPVLSASGGLIGMMYGGQAMPENNMDVKYKEFSGMVGGRGDGMEDNVYMPIVEGERGQQVATLAVSPKEYVVDANTMSLLGNGNPDEGAEIMDQTVKDIRKKATGQTKQQKEIDGLAALNRMRRSV